MTEDHLLYAPEREQFRLFVSEQQGKNRAKNSNCLSPKSNTDDAATHTQNSCPHSEHTPSDNPWQPHHNTPATGGSSNSSGSCPPPVMPSQIYGAEHLLRLFLKFPHFLGHAGLPASHTQLLHHQFRELLAYLCGRRTELFQEENYESHSSTTEEETLKHRREGEREQTPSSTVTHTSS